MSSEGKHELADEASLTQIERANPGSLHDEAERPVFPLIENKWESVKRHPKAIACCCYMLFTCLMWGYDGLASAIVLSIPQWRRDYGYIYNGDYVVSAGWQVALTAASMIGLVLGGALTGPVSGRFGQKICIFGGYLSTIGGVFLQWFSVGNMGMFFAGKLLIGVPLGVFLTTAPVYCSEVAPLQLRGVLVAAINFTIVTGQLMVYGVMRETQGIANGANSYRIIFAVQWGFAGAGLIGLYFVPESPTRLVARGKLDAARKSISTLYSADTSVEQMVEQIGQNLREVTTSQGSVKECFSKANRMRTAVAVSVFFVQASSGVAWVQGYMGYFLQLAGLDPATVPDITLAISGSMAVGTMASWPLIDQLGRRGLIITGLLGCTICLAIIGALGCYPEKGRPVVLGQVAFMAIWGFIYQASIGSVGYTVATEVPTSSLRNITLSLGTIVNGLSQCIWAFTLPLMINPDQANLGGKVGFIFFAVLAVCDVFVFFCYPETKGRTFEEIDELYAKRVPARQFYKTDLEPMSFQANPRGASV